ncbi:NmrA-like family protein [Sphaerulina musiva SO2202]|uniref:NmrA-like family protein n=1 Tax=Sphaerulina musiva (strain SO2202) TaxID=692275 RepID=M3BYE1_SPHMS|nr:NmrA-like family protein [Sphaerulina musiva SO2202]EMF13076.1 NmrA-like family protein [Sphaerulina musiva SO2202]
MSIKSVVLLGADGNLGPSIYAALQKNDFDITVLKRKSSKSKTTYPKQVSVSDEFPVDELVPVLQGHDAVIVTIRGSDPALQNRIADAAARAGIKRFIPADFGSVDSSSPLTQDLVPLYRLKTSIREHLISLASSSQQSKQQQNSLHEFTWTSLVCGHFFDWSLEFLHIDLANRHMEILDDGNTTWSASTLDQIALATVGVLQRPEETRNRMLYIQSFCVSQNEVLRAFERATSSSSGSSSGDGNDEGGEKKWKVTKLDSKVYREEKVKKRDEGDKQAIEDLVWLLGALDANWEDRKDFAMKDLGLENEDLDEVVRKIVEKQERE